MTDAIREPRRTLTGIAAIGFFVFALDRLTKVWIVHGLDLPLVGRIEVAPPFLTLVMAWNTGINFGILGAANLRWVLVGLAVAISIGLAVWAVRRGTPALVPGVGLVVGGAIGNAWDRVQYGAVADFLNMSCCGIHNPYAFNVADIAIFLGAVLIAWKA